MKSNKIIWPGNNQIILNPQTIMGANCTHRWKSTNGIGIVTGVATWTDIVAGVIFNQITLANQPTFNASGGSNNKPFLTLDGVNDSMAAVLVRAAPGTTPRVLWAIVRQLTWGSNEPLFNDASTAFIVRQRTSSAQLSQFNTTDVNLTAAQLPLNVWGNLQSNFTNSNNDRNIVNSNAPITGANAGNTAGTGPLLGRNATSTLFCNFDISELCYFDAVPNALQLTQLAAYRLSEYAI